MFCLLNMLEILTSLKKKCIFYLTSKVDLILDLFKYNIFLKFKYKILPTLLCLIIFINHLKAQEDWDFENTEKSISFFSDTRSINGHTVNVLEEKVLELRITHRFGNLATSQAYRTLFGLDNSTDIRIGFEYGINDKLMIGAGRSKGYFPFSEVWDGLIKYQLLKNNSSPFAVALGSNMTFISMLKSNDPSSLTNFTKLAHRINYHTELLIAYQPHSKITFQVNPGIMYLNKVHHEDQNLQVVLGSTVKFNVYDKINLIGEYYWQPFATNYRINNYQNPFGIGIEIKTFAHVFQLNFMNSKGIGAGQFIPFTQSKWNKGEFRFGFTIARKFNN